MRTSASSGTRRTGAQGFRLYLRILASPSSPFSTSVLELLLFCRDRLRILGYPFLSPSKHTTRLALSALPFLNWASDIIIILLSVS